MSGPGTDYQACLEWIYQQRDSIEVAKYGRNLRSVKDAIAEQQTKAKVIADYRRQVDRATRTASAADKERMEKAYSNLVEMSQKKLNCLHTMLEICNMEEYCGNLSNEFDLKAVHLVKPDQRAKMVGQETGDQIPGFVSPSSQDCIFAAKDNWNWLVRLVKCIEIHLKNAAEYHQFFHDTDETEVFMEEDLKKLENTFNLEPVNGDYNDAKRLLEELETLLTALRQWETKTTLQWDQATRVLPVHLRTEGVTEPTPVRALCEYQTKELHVREGEDLLLLDNTKTNMWKVRNNKGQDAYIPALVCLIPGPYKDAVDAAVKMRLKLLTAWTTCLKRIGKKLIMFMLTVFKPVYRQDEIKLLKSIKEMERSDLLRILDFIEDTLKVHWGDNEAFINLQERILALKMILEEAGEYPLQDEGVFNALVVQITMLEKLMDKYKDLWRDWEVYKTALETSRQPELMLMVDKWEQLQFVTKEYFSKFWQTDLGLTPEERHMTGISRVTARNAQLPLNAAEFMFEEIDTRAAVSPNRSETVTTTVEETKTQYGKASVNNNQDEWQHDQGSSGYGENRTDYQGGRYSQGDGGTIQINRTAVSDGKQSRTPLSSLRTTVVTEENRPNRGVASGTQEPAQAGYSISSRTSRGSPGAIPASGDTTSQTTGYSISSRTSRGSPGAIPASGDTASQTTGYSISSRTTSGSPGAIPASGDTAQSSGYSTSIGSKGSLGGGNQTSSDSTTHSSGYESNRSSLGSGEHGDDWKTGYKSSTRTTTSSSSTSRLAQKTASNKTGDNEGWRHDEGSSGYGESTKNIKHDEGSSGYGESTKNIKYVQQQSQGGNEWSSIDQEDVIQSMGDGYEQLSSPSLNDSTDFGYATETRIAETEQIASSEMEEKKTFIISSVLDPRTDDDISLQEAIMCGIINPEEGIYVNPSTGEKCPIPAAMSSGMIKVSFTTTKRSREKKSSIGIITVKTIREQVRPFTIRGVKDTMTGEVVSHEVAAERGLLDEARGAYKDRRGRLRLTLSEAIEKGYVIVEHTTQTSPPEVVSNSYAVRAVVDRARKRIITFAEAVQRGIILKDSGAYRDSATGETMYVGDAIMRGFLKARQIDDPKTLDIDPRNTVVIDKTETIKKKLLQPLGVISAFRRAAKTLKR